MNLLRNYSIIIIIILAGTYEHFCFAAQSFAVIVGGNDLELEIGSPHVFEHHGSFDQPRVSLNHKSFLAILDGGNDESVLHGTVIPSVLIIGLMGKTKQAEANKVNMHGRSH